MGQVVVDSVAQLTQVAGFCSSPGEGVDRRLQGIWQSANLDESSQCAQLDAFVYGQAPFLVGLDANGRLQITAESPLQMTIEWDPATGKPAAGLKKWTDLEGYSRSRLWVRGHWWEWASKNTTPYDVLINQTTAAMYRAEDSLLVRDEVDPLEELPFVVLVGRPRTGLPDGESDLETLHDLIRSLSKIVSDLLVASEWAAAPRRWITGLAPGDSFGGMSKEQREDLTDSIRKQWEETRSSKFVAATETNARFGSFDVAELTNYETASRR